MRSMSLCFLVKLKYLDFLILTSMGSDTLLSHVGGFGHGFTYSGHPVACAVALEALRIYKYAIPVPVIC
jgi:hypothetical protein